VAEGALPAALERLTRDQETVGGSRGIERIAKVWLLGAQRDQG
jgi:hypothetical protein